jgi:predicted RNA-binding Zn ribbon-like protein
VNVPDLYPGEPLPIRLMNTVWADRHGVHDSLSTVDQLQTWARQCGLESSGGIHDDELSEARALRDALRRLAAAALSDDRPAAVSDLPVSGAADILNGLLLRCVPELSVLNGGTVLARGWRLDADGFRSDLLRIGLQGRDLLDDAPRRVGACHGPGCVLYFHRSPARREWCSSGCGNRARVSRHYHRQREQAQRPAE